MYLDECKFKRGDKHYSRILLRESYREDGKTKKKTIANLSNCTDEQIEALRFALKHPGKIEELNNISQEEFVASKSVGAVSILYHVMNKLGIIKALGNSDNGKIASWLIASRIIDQGSRLSSYRLLDIHAGREIFNLPKYDQWQLYECLDWLHLNQEHIENKLFSQMNKSSTIYLYDVSSTYLEGNCNELACYGYNRDKKSGKKQVVYGLLTDNSGNPISIEVFEGNTKDNKTVKHQLQTLKERFNCTNVTFVGDKGMIKSAQVEEIAEYGFNYITTISKPEIKTLINKNIIQMELFDDKLMEVENDGVRYIFRKNKYREEEIRFNRNQRIEKLRLKIAQSNQYLSDHPKAKVETQENILTETISKYKLKRFISLKIEGKKIDIEFDEFALSEESKLDGCYVVKTDLKLEDDNKENIHDRYKGLAQVETAFRNFKKSFLEAQPVFVRKAERTRAHFFIISLAYKVSKYINDIWKKLNCNVQDGLKHLTNITSYKYRIKKSNILKVLRPNNFSERLISSLGATVPTVIPLIE